MHWLTLPRGTAVVVHLAVVTTFLAYRLFGYGLRHTTAQTATTLTLAEPAVATLLGVVLLSERLPALSWCGLGVLSIGLAVLTLPASFLRWCREDPAACSVGSEGLKQRGRQPIRRGVRGGSPLQLRALLIRRNRHIVQDRPSRSVCWADIPQLTARDGCCPTARQQYWQQSRRTGFAPGAVRQRDGAGWPGYQDAINERAATIDVADAHPGAANLA
jgi:multidrug transporter EmrE-like cation transporter